ncbi:hypothetical protein, partial [Mesorhizobium australicum]|uniref:hypothetical protein n=1 Tax=Mesorhizobium australicum TaxID=536018 RepID=UPI00333BAF0B
MLTRGPGTWRAPSATKSRSRIRVRPDKAHLISEAWTRLWLDAWKRDPKIERCYGKGLHSFICHHPDFANALQQRAAQRSRLSPLATKSSKAIRRVET